MTVSPPRPAKSASLPRLSVAAGLFVAVLGGSEVARAQLQPPSTGDRVLGLDVSAWQGDITTAEWATFKRRTNQQVGGVFGDGRDFVFIRSSRGGTTGYYNQNDADNSEGNNTLSQRYDDPYFIRNITRATSAGLFAGSYHFGRMDIISSTQNSGGIANTGTDEANHFLEMAGPWMRPGYLLPVFDLEAGISQRTGQQLAQFAIDFSDRIFAVKGIRPAVYIGGNYAQEIQNEATTTTERALVAAYPTLWSPRWPNQEDPDSIPIQTGHPKDTSTNIYGPWDDSPNPTHPWRFWQYTSTGRLNGNNNGASNTDLNVAQGNIEFLKDSLVPAVWMSASSGNWKDLANWNSGETPVAPVQGPGQVARVGSLTLPGPRTPGTPDPLRSTVVTGANDTVNLNRPNENITVTFDSSTPATNIRKLNLNERLNVTGGSLNVAMTGIAGTGATLALSGGTTTIDQATFDPGSALEFGGAGTLTVASLVLNTNVTYNGASGTGVVNGKPGAAPINLGGATRAFNVGDGNSNVDLRIALPIANGNLNKDGAGTLELTGNNAGYTGTLAVNNGRLLLTGNNQLGTAGVRTNQASQTVGGSVAIEGSGLNVNSTLRIAGLGLSNSAALENVSGNNTWSGAVRLVGTQANPGDAGLNQIGAANGALTITGVIQNDGASATSWAKTGAGDVVLAGASPNTYSNLTRVFGGRLILEKNGALGTAGSSSLADGNTFQLPGAVSTLAFRSAASLNYSTVEWIHTEGVGVAGLGQIDNLGGTNVFAGHVGLGGPSVGGIQQATIGVSAGSLELAGGLYARSTTAPEIRGITKLGAGTLILSGNSGPAPTNASDKSLVNSTFNVSGGAVVLKGLAGDAANVPGVTTWNLNPAGRLTLDRTGATGAASVALNGGTLHTSVAGINLPGLLNTDPTGTGGTVDIGAGASLTVGGLNNPGGKAVAKIGPGTFNVAGPQTHGVGAVLSANAGVVNFNSDAGSVAQSELSVNVAGGVVVNFNTAQHLAALDITAGGRASLASGGLSMLKATDLVIGDTGVLETYDNDLLIDYPAGGPSPYKRLAGYAISAFLGRPGGIIRAGAVVSPTQILSLFDNAGVGLAAWEGEPIDATTVIGKYVFFGDSNFDGQVAGDDYVVAHSEESDGGFQVGDYTFDGLVNYLDYAAIDANLGRGSGDPSLEALRQRMIADHTALWGDPYLEALTHAESGDFAWLLTASAVPEPSSALGLFALAGVFCRRRGWGAVRGAPVA